MGRTDFIERFSTGSDKMTRLNRSMDGQLPLGAEVSLTLKVAETSLGNLVGPLMARAHIGATLKPALSAHSD
jgi:hypothetical protein